MVKVSVIVPICNVEKYLRKCLDSIMNQTLKDIEIILINDASPDSSADIMKEYEAKDARIKCIYLDANLMMGGARNRGIDIAEGEYLTFVDADDYLELSMLEKLYHSAKAVNSDMVFCNYHYVREDGSIIKDVALFPPEFDGELKEGKKKGIINKLAYPWGKLFRTAYFNQENIRFPEGIIYEDGPTIPLVILYMQRCSYIGEALYNYVLHDQSAMNKRNSNKHLDTQKSAGILKERMLERGLYPRYKDETDFYFIVRFYKNMLEICLKFYDKIPIDIMGNTRDYFKKNYPGYKRNPYYLTLTGEERMLLQMNDISPRLAVWWHRNRHVIMKKLGRYREGLLYYSKYYKTRKLRLDKLLENYSDKRIGLWGAGLKKVALEKVVRKNLRKQINYDIIQEQKDSITGKEVLFENIKDQVEVIFVVNPSFYLSIKKLVDDSGFHIKLINVEDYLNEYIELNDL